ncbi:MAG: MFS transporter [Gammaproteobacteria bacterium]
MTEPPLPGSPPTPARESRRAVWSWAFYDWANSVFATTVMAGFFPVFFKQYWNAGAPVVESTFRLGVANSAASLAVLMLAPLLGALADRLRWRKGLLAVFALLGIVMTAGLYFVGQNEWHLAALLYGLAVLGFAGANLFYDALLVVVAGRADMDRLSALGYALGYLGGGLLFAVNVLMTLYPDWFGLDSRAQAVRVSFLTVALWWAVFSVPLLLFVREPARGAVRGPGRPLSDSLRRLLQTLREVGHLPQAFLFLGAYWLYIDGVDTVIRMAVDYGMSLGFPSNSLIVALLITQFVGFPAAIACGWLGARIGAKTAILFGLAVYIGVTLQGVFMTHVWQFYLLAVLVGLVQGGVQSLSRSMYARLIPAQRAGEFFGFYNMLGKFAAVLGPALMGGVALLTGSPRLSILSVVVLFLAGGGLLLAVDPSRGERDAARQ